MTMSAWFLYAIGAAVLYGLHQVFTKMASDRISEGLGSLVVEGTAALTILLYLAWLRFGGKWNQAASEAGLVYSVLTGVCVGAGTVVFAIGIEGAFSGDRLVQSTTKSASATLPCW